MNTCYRLNEPHGLVRLEGLGKLKKIHSIIRSRTRDLPGDLPFADPSSHRAFKVSSSEDACSLQLTDVSEEQSPSSCSMQVPNPNEEVTALLVNV
jgi:hypothetical protein